MADPGEQKYFLAYPYPKNFNSFLKLIDHHLENPMTDIIYIGYEENSDTYRNYSKNETYKLYFAYLVYIYFSKFPKNCINILLNQVPKLNDEIQ